MSNKRKISDIGLFNLKAKVWVYPGMAAWRFLSLPKKESQEIGRLFAEQKRGWGSLPVLVTIGKTSWKTSIFPDKKSGSYLLPLKVEVRKKEDIRDGDLIYFAVKITV